MRIGETICRMADSLKLYYRERDRINIEEGFTYLPVGVNVSLRMVDVYAKFKSLARRGNSQKRGLKGLIRHNIGSDLGSVLGVTFLGGTILALICTWIFFLVSIMFNVEFDVFTIFLVCFFLIEFILFTHDYFKNLMTEEMREGRKYMNRFKRSGFGVIPITAFLLVRTRIFKVPLSEVTSDQGE